MDLLTLLLVNLVYLATGDKCAEECTCKWKSGKRTVECVDRGLAGIPESIDPETQVLDSSNNDIKILPSMIFIRVRLTNLQRLYLKDCRIERIDDDAFAGLSNLVELDLSHNLLVAVPSASFKKTPFLRDLVLASNPLERVFADVFDTTPNLVKLDLSHARLVELEAKGFTGLEHLESLKLSNNLLATLHPGTFQPLTRLTNIELHDNPWVCDCHLRELKMWLLQHNLPTLISPVCHGPAQLSGRFFTDLTIDQYACRPILMLSSRYAEATIGENASIVCRVSAIPPARVRWYWNGRHLTNHSAFNSYQKVLIFEDGQFRKRSTLVLTNAQESEATELFCVAENEAGSVEANFTLHVSLRTAGISTLGSGQIAGISAALIVLVLLILLVVMVLFVRLKRAPPKQIKAGPATESTETPPPSESRQAPRGKIEEIEVTTFGFEPKPHPGTLNLSYVQRPLHNNDPPLGQYRRFDEAQVAVHGACFSSSTTSLMVIDNPDLIRDTGRNDDDVAFGPPEFDEGKLLYPEYLWGAPDARSAPAPHKEAPPEHYPGGAKQVRVWQKGVPVLPPVSALKRVLGSTRSSPDEGYQEGTGTDV